MLIPEPPAHERSPSVWSNASPSSMPAALLAHVPLPGHRTFARGADLEHVLRIHCNVPSPHRSASRSSGERCLPDTEAVCHRERPGLHSPDTSSAAEPESLHPHDRERYGMPAVRNPSLSCVQAASDRTSVCLLRTAPLAASTNAALLPAAFSAAHFPFLPSPTVDAAIRFLW